MTPPALPRPTEIVSIEDEMKRSYLDYAMSVIVSRALPDIRDGLKPVQRRILHAMREGGYASDRPHRKSAKIVGEVMGNFHPHGDSAIYDAMVRMAQDFSMRLQLIDGQGNFGSMDDDPPAAMRYTESRLAKAADALLADIDKDTVDFKPTYDESSVEPVVLPAQFPNLLVNGAGGIAVGMATNIPPHNLGELVDALLLLIDDPATPTERLLEVVQGPDFPTGAVILGRSGIVQAYTTGRGSVIIRSKSHVETVRSERQALVLTEVPFQQNKARLLEKIAEVVRERRVEGIAELRDESDRQGVRVVIELKRDADPDVVLNQLCKFTPVQTSFGINMVALTGGRPSTVTLRETLEAFLDFREEVVTRRTAFDLGRARERAHVLVGLAAAVADIDAVIALIRAAENPVAAREQLVARAWPTEQVAPFLALVEPAEGQEPPDAATFRLSERQARAILDLQLQRLTGLEREKITGELREIAARIGELLLVLRSRTRLFEVIRGELVTVRERFATPRRTLIDLESEPDADLDDLIQREEMVVTVTRLGYVKRVPLATFRAQRRGGKGRSGIRTHDDDIVTKVFVTNTHTPVLFFSSLGRVYRLKVYKLPMGSPQSRGKPFVQLFPLAERETVTAVLPLPEDETSWASLSVFFATAQGKVRRNELSDFVRVPAAGKIAMGLDEGDRLVGAAVCDESHDIMLSAAGGKAIRFPLDSVRVFKSRASEGVRGMDLPEGDEVVALSVLDHVELPMEEREQFLRWSTARRRINGGGDPGAGDAAPSPDAPIDPAPLNLPLERLEALAAEEQLVLTITRRGFGKRSSAFEYRVTNRGGQGIIGIETSARNGPVTAAFPVADGDQLMLVTDRGKTIRIPVTGIRIAARNTQGVRLFMTEPGEQVVSAARLPEVAAETVETDEVVDEAAAAAAAVAPDAPASEG